MATGVEDLLDMLYEMVDEAKGVPLSGDKCMIEREKALDILDDVRAQFPVEFAEARKLLATREEYLASAKREAELIRKQAEDKAKVMVGENELVTQARQKSAQMLKDAQDQVQGLQRTVEQYCDDLLKRTGAAIAEAGKELTQVHSDFRAAMGAPAKPSFDVAMDD